MVTGDGEGGGGSAFFAADPTHGYTIIMDFFYAFF